MLSLCLYGCRRIPIRIKGGFSQKEFLRRESNSRGRFVVILNPVSGKKMGRNIYENVVKEKLKEKQLIQNMPRSLQGIYKWIVLRD
jgi:hypothetical protein